MTNTEAEPIRFQSINFPNEQGVVHFDYAKSEWEFIKFPIN